MSQQVGKVAQVIGPVVDVSFELHGGKLPNILDALEIIKGSGQKVILECQQHIGEDTIRAIAMDSTDGLTRGMEVKATGSGIKMPIGDKVKGRLFNVVGEAIDGIDTVDNHGGRAIHAELAAGCGAWCRAESTGALSRGRARAGSVATQPQPGPWSGQWATRYRRGPGLSPGYWQDGS